MATPGMPISLGAFDQFVDIAETVEQGVFGVDVKMDK